jgi:hypothetical protein
MRRLVWATPRAVLSLAELISPHLEQLDDERWELLYGRLERSNKVDKFVIQQSMKVALEHCGLRLSVAIALRLPREKALEIAEAKLGDYRGNDRRLLRFDLENVLPLALQSPSKWKTVLPKVRHAYKMDVSINAPFIGRSEQNSNIPPSVAKVICTNAKEYPLHLIEAAQSQLTKQAGSRAKAPGAVSKAEGWFG